MKNKIILCFVSSLCLLMFASCGEIDEKDQNTEKNTEAVMAEASDSVLVNSIAEAEPSEESSLESDLSSYNSDMESEADESISERELDVDSFETLTVYDVYFEWDEPDTWEIKDRDVIEKIVSMWQSRLADSEKVDEDKIDTSVIKAGPTAKVINFKHRDYPDLEEISLFYGSQSNYQYNVVFDGELYMVDDELVSEILDYINSERPDQVE